MGDARTAQGVGKMFPGTLGGQARPAQPHTPPVIPTRWVKPPAPPILYDSSVPIEYVVPLLDPDASVDDHIHYERTSAGNLYEGPGVSHDEPIAGNFDAINWFVPGGLDVTVEINFWFLEIDSDDPTGSVTRGLRIVITRDGDLSEVANVTGSYPGTRAVVNEAKLVAGPYDIPEPFTISPFCNWGSVSGPRPPRKPRDMLGDQVGDPWAIYVTGRLI